MKGHPPFSLFDIWDCWPSECSWCPFSLEHKSDMATWECRRMLLLSIRMGTRWRPSRSWARTTYKLTGTPGYVTTTTISVEVGNSPAVVIVAAEWTGDLLSNPVAAVFVVSSVLFLWSFSCSLSTSLVWRVATADGCMRFLNVAVHENL